MREAGDVCFADAFRDGSGVVEFLRYEDMKYAIKKLDDSRFRSHEVSNNFFLLFILNTINLFFYLTGNNKLRTLLFGLKFTVKILLFNVSVLIFVFTAIYC